MKLKDLIQIAGIPKQTIHYYLQQGLLPKPRKLGRNLSEYDQRHVDRIRLIKELQEDYFLPLSVIKKILKKYNREPETRAMLKIRREYFRPLSQLLAGKIKGEDAFLEETGLRRKRLHQYEHWGLITPEIVNDQKVYSHDDQVIGKVIDEWRKIGMTAEKGFEPDTLWANMKVFRDIVKNHSEYFFSTASRTMSDKEVMEMAKLALEITALFYYHLYRKLGAGEMQKKEQEMKLRKINDR
jgi:DNA-binding transcriptional MerR regulator